MHIAFINLGDCVSKNEYPQLGLLYLVSIARQQGHVVDFFDCTARNQTVEGIFNAVNRFKPDICAFSLYTQGLPGQYRFIKQIKNCHPSCTIFVGGPHASALPEKTMEECDEIDYLIFGEGEVTLDELLAAIRANQKPDHIDGICFRRDGAVVKNKERPLIENLDSIPIPAYDLIFEKGYRYHNRKMEVGGKVAAVISSRGCPWDCAFCYKGTFGRRYRRRSPKNVIDEIKTLMSKYSVSDITFVDDLFAINKRWLEDFCQGLKTKNITIPWKCLGRVDILDKKMMAMMKRHGCYGIEFGVESGSQEVLNDINKKITLDQIRTAFEDARSVGLMRTAFFIFGNRLDTESTVRKTMELAKEIKPDFVGFATLLPFPGTKVYRLLDDCVRYKWEMFSSYYGYKHPFSICSIDAGKLQKYGEQAPPEYYGRMTYLRDNILRASHSLKIKMYQVLFFIFFFMKKFWIKIKRDQIFE